MSYAVGQAACPNFAHYVYGLVCERAKTERKVDLLNKMELSPIMVLMDELKDELTEVNYAINMSKDISQLLRV